MTTVLVQNNILLRPYTLLDIDAFLEVVKQSQPHLSRWLPWCRADFSRTDAHDWFATTIDCWKDQTAYEFGVFDATTGEFLGGAGLNLVNRRNSLCNLGYWVRHDRLRQGIASQIVCALTRFGFQHCQFNRIEIVVAQGNEPSMGVARKAGALLECLARNRLVIDGKPVAAAVFSLVPPALAQCGDSRSGGTATSGSISTSANVG